MDARALPAPRLLYVVSEDWYFLSHRLPMARAARAAGFEVHVATTPGTEADEIVSEGFILHPVRFRRGALSPFRAWRTIRALRKIYREVDPAIVHHVALQPIAYGIVASIGFKFAAIYAVTGLGHAFVAEDDRARSLRGGIRALLRFGLNRRRAMGLVQNPDDRDMLEAIGVRPEHIALIRGSGIDADRFRPIPEPPGPVTVAFVGRMLAIKGVRTLIAAHRLIRKSTRVRNPARGHSRFGQPDQHSADRSRRVGPRAGHHLARPRRQRRDGVAPRPHCGAALPRRRRFAEKPA